MLSIKNKKKPISKITDIKNNPLFLRNIPLNVNSSSIGAIKITLNKVNSKDSLTRLLEFIISIELK